MGLISLILTTICGLTFYFTGEEFALILAMFFGMGTLGVIFFGNEQY